MKIKRRQITALTVEIKLDELIRNFTASTTDILIGMDPEEARTHIDVLEHVLKALTSRDLQQIRNVFREGYTMQLMGNVFGQIEQAAHVDIHIKVEGSDIPLEVPHEYVNF